VYKQTENGNKFLAFYFKNSAGETVSRTEWEVKKTDRITQEQYESKIVNQISRIKQIVTKYIPEEQYNSDVNTFEDFCKKTIELLGDKHKDVKIRIKVVYDSNGYTTLPNYSKYQFIESMDISSDSSKIKVLNIDQMERAPRNNEYDNEALFQTAGQTQAQPTTQTTTQGNPNDLPF
jgi:hypothetical protein